MPASFAHYSFGKELLPNMPDDVRQCIQRFRRMYDMGLQGPDFFFHYNWFVNNPVRKLARTYHRQSGQEFFTRACQVCDSEAARAYLYGVLGHYCLDSACHPFVHAMADSGQAGHVALEAEFDRFLLARSGNPAPHTYRITRHMKVTRGECMTIASFYPPATGGNVRHAIRLMNLDLDFFAKGNREKREKLLRRFSPESADYFLPLTPVEGYTRMVSELYARYNRCRKQYPMLLEQLECCRKTGQALGAEFEACFG